MTARRLFLVTALCAAATLCVSAQARDWFGGESIKPSGEIVSENRDVGAFDAIALAGDFHVEVRQGSTATLGLKGDKNILAAIETKVVTSGKGRTLEISPKSGMRYSGVSPEVSIELPQLRSVSVAGSSVVHVQAMKSGTIEAKVAGSGDIAFDDLSADELALKISGSGNIAAKGRVNQLTASIAGSGDVKARDLLAEEGKISIAGSGDAAVQINKKLHVSIAGSGDVAYLGSPEVSSSVVGSGTVRKLNP